MSLSAAGQLRTSCRSCDVQYCLIQYLACWLLQWRHPDVQNAPLWLSHHMFSSVITMLLMCHAVAVADEKLPSIVWPVRYSKSACRLRPPVSLLHICPHGSRNVTGECGNTNHSLPTAAHLPEQDLEKPEQTYRKLGAKLVVGMPFKDQATSDTLILRETPPASDKDKRRALARLQVHCPFNGCGCSSSAMRTQPVHLRVWKSSHRTLLWRDLFAVGDATLYCPCVILIVMVLCWTPWLHCSWSCLRVFCDVAYIGGGRACDGACGASSRRPPAACGCDSHPC